MKLSREYLIWSGLAVLLAGLIALALIARPAYHRFKERRVMAQARLFFDKGEEKKCALSLRQALGLNQKNAQAVRMMADLLDRAQNPYVLGWRQRAVELDPTTENRILLVATALRASDVALGQRVLNEVAVADRESAPYHSVAAHLAIKLNKTGEAEQHLQALIRAEPTNRLHQLNLAVLHLSSTNDPVVVAARQSLEQSAGDPAVALDALRSLTVDALNRGDLVRANVFSKRLVAEKGAGLSHKLQHLSVLKGANGVAQGTESGGEEFESFLTAVQKDVQTNATSVAEVADWMNAHELSVRALTWLKGLPQEFQTEQPIPLAKANCYLARKDWSGLESYLDSEKWKNQEFVRFALLGRCAREANNGDLAEAYWHRARRAATENADALTQLWRMAKAWGWNRQADDALQTLADQFPTEKWPLQALVRTYIVQATPPGPMTRSNSFSRSIRTMGWRKMTWRWCRCCSTVSRTTRINGQEKAMTARPKTSRMRPPTHFHSICKAG